MFPWCERPDLNRERRLSAVCHWQSFSQSHPHVCRSFPAATRFCYGLLEYHSVKTSTKARGLWARRYPGFPSKHRRPLSYLRPGVSLVGMKGFEPNMRLQTRHSFKAGSMTPASARIPFPRHIPMCARLSGPPAVFPCCQQIVSRRPLG